MKSLRIGNFRIRFNRNAEKGCKSVRYTSYKKPRTSKMNKVTDASQMFKRATVVIISVYIVTALIGFGIRKRQDANGLNMVDASKTRGTIFLDAGHGGQDHGMSTEFRNESDDNLKLVIKIKKNLEKQNYKVYLSRSSDKYVNHSNRVKMANKKNADLFISVHRDYKPDNSGVGAYIYSSNSLKSQYLAGSILAELGSTGEIPKINGIHLGTRDGNENDYPENSSAKMPSCVLIIGSAASRGDNILFDKNIDYYAEAIANGISVSYDRIYHNDRKLIQKEIDEMFGISEGAPGLKGQTESSNSSGKSVSNDNISDQAAAKSKRSGQYDQDENSYGDLVE